MSESRGETKEYKSEMEQGVYTLCCDLLTADGNLEQSKVSRSLSLTVVAQSEHCNGSSPISFLLMRIVIKRVDFDPQILNAR